MNPNRKSYSIRFQRVKGKKGKVVTQNHPRALAHANAGNRRNLTNFGLN